MKKRILLDEARWIPHRLSRSCRQVEFISTSADRLRSLPFIDGREPLSTGPSVTLDLDDLSLPGGSDEPLRMIFHLSFCGSTLLARLLDEPGLTLALKEPQILVDLADWRTARDRQGNDDPRFAPTLWSVASLLNRPWRPGEKIVMKPSNWANNLIPPLEPHPDGARIIFVTIDRRRFLIALLRGGRDRLAFNARVLAHLAAGEAGMNRLMEEALRGRPDPLAAMLRFGALSHYLQNRVFERAGGPGAFVDLAEMETSPEAAVLRAASLLALPEPGNLRKKMEEDAKNPGRSFSLHERRRIDASIESLHGEAIDAALTWADAHLPSNLPLPGARVSGGQAASGSRSSGAAVSPAGEESSEAAA